MTTFIIIPTIGNHSKLNEEIPKRFGNDAIILPKGEWLIRYSGTSKQLSDDIGISTDSENSTIVLSTNGYWGRASKDIWEWLA